MVAITQAGFQATNSQHKHHEDMSQQTYYPTQVTTISDLLSSANTKCNHHDYLGALTEYNQAIAMEPERAMAYCGRGVAYYRLGEIQNAQSDYTRAIELQPYLAIPYYRRGFLHYLAKDYASAIADYNRSIELQPDFALAYSNRGYAYRDLYGEQEAVIDWRFAAKLFKEQGNLVKYQSMMQSIEQVYGDESCASGMLW